MSKTLYSALIKHHYLYDSMFIPRILSKKLKESVQQFPVVAIMGPRQSGKTTLVREVFPEKTYVSLENLDDQHFAESDPRGFLSTYPDAIFDEVQRVPTLLSYMQGVVDREKKQGQYILTGSQNFLLHEHISQSLAGRAALLTLLPLSIEEMHTTVRNTSLSTAGILFKGLYPRIYGDSVNPYDWYQSYVRSYLERDVRLIKNITNLSSFQKFLRLCAGRIGQLLNLSSLASDCGITHNTARSWLSILEASFVVFLLQPYHGSFNKRIVKSPKLYFVDTGYACSLLGIEKESQLETHPLRGGLFESLIVSECVKYRCNRGLQSQCFFWRDKTGHEVDVLIELPNELIAIEIKSGKTIASDYFTNITFLKKAARTITRSYVVYGGEERQQRTEAVVLGWRNTASIFEDGENSSLTPFSQLI